MVDRKMMVLENGSRVLLVRLGGIEKQDRTRQENGGKRGGCFQLLLPW